MACTISSAIQKTCRIHIQTGPGEMDKAARPTAYSHTIGGGIARRTCKPSRNCRSANSQRNAGELFESTDRVWKTYIWDNTLLEVKAGHQQKKTLRIRKHCYAADAASKTFFNNTTKRTHRARHIYPHACPCAGAGVRDGGAAPRSP